MYQNPSLDPSLSLGLHEAEKEFWTKNVKINYIFMITWIILNNVKAAILIVWSKQCTLFLRRVL